jgi:hypothetical protein
MLGWLAMLAWLTCTEAALATPQLVDSSKYPCLRPSVAHSYPLLASGSEYRIHGWGAEAKTVAHADLGFLESNQVWSVYKRLGAQPSPPLTIYELAPDARKQPGTSHVNGISVLRICGSKGPFNSIVLQAKHSRYTVAHEVFHEFQYAVVNATMPETWWQEATALWGGSIFENPGRPDQEKAFFDTPSQPIDARNGAREYGAGHFVESLRTQINPDLKEPRWWKLLRDSLPSAHVLDLLRAELPGFGLTLADVEADFWANHVGPKPRYAPAAANLTRTIDGGSGSVPVPFSLGHDATEIVRLKLGGLAPKKITLQFPAAGSSQRFLLRLGLERATVSQGNSQVSFCVTGSEPGALPWPVDGVTIGLTNGSLQSGGATIAITKSDGDNDCTQPTPLTKSLPAHCPGPPPNVDFNGHPYRSYGARFGRVLVDWTEWLALATAKYGPLASTRKAKRFSPFFACAAKRADQVANAAPDATSRHFVRHWASAIRAAVLPLEHNDFNAYSSVTDKATSAVTNLFAYTEKKDAQQDGLAPA